MVGEQIVKAIQNSEEQIAKPRGYAKFQGSWLSCANQPGSGRLAFVDVSRCCAIYLALFSHGMDIFAGYTHLDAETEPWLRLFTRSATPMFAFIFGMMLELVYARKAELFGFPQTCRRLLVRSFHCYLAFVVMALAAVIGDDVTPLEALKSVAFMGFSPGRIMRFFALAILLSIPLIGLRIRYGRKVLLFALLLLIVFIPWLNQARGFNFGWANHWLSILSGASGKTGGPSVVHGMIFVISGMLAAAMLAAQNDGFASMLNAFRRTATGLLIACAVVTMWLLYAEGGKAVFDGFLRGAYRHANHVGYYSAGMGLALINLIVLTWLFPGDSSGLPRWVREAGSSTFLSFTLGNVLLNLFGWKMQSAPAAIAGSIAVLVLMTWIVMNRRRLQSYDTIRRWLLFEGAARASPGPDAQSKPVDLYRN